VLTMLSTTLLTLVSCVMSHHVTSRAHGVTVPAGGNSSGQRKLDNDSNNFERKRTDRFEVGRCMLNLRTSVLKAPMVSALEATM
jgi:hypothetical protein